MDLASKKLSLTAAFAAVLAFLIANAWIVAEAMADLREHQAAVVLTKSVQRELTEGVSVLKDVVLDQRGFALTRDQAFVDRFDAAAQEVYQHVERLEELVAANPGFRANATLLRQDIDADIAWERRAIDHDRGAAAAGLLDREEGKAHMDATRALAAQMLGAADRLLIDRSAAAKTSSENVNRSFIITTAIDAALLALAYFLLRRSIRQQAAERARLSHEGWLRAGIADLSGVLRDARTIAGLSDATLAFFQRYVAVRVGTFYVVDAAAGAGDLTLATALGAPPAPHGPPARLQSGTGLAGAALSKGEIVEVDGLPRDYLKVSSTLGETRPVTVMAMPLSHEGQVVGAIELAWLDGLDAARRELLTAAQKCVASSLSAALAQARQQELLEETQRQAEELAAQQEELRATNEEIAARAETLRRAQEALQQQQEELRQANDELERQAQTLAVQAEQARARAQELEAAKSALETASRYKSEFLANMSHELRTPLNSLLILASLLAENREGTLTEKQVDFAHTIRRAGNDLLALINDVLDLAKVEAGRLDIDIEEVALASLSETMRMTFAPVAAEKGLGFAIDIDAGTPVKVRTDRKRVEQILKNLLSNAFKFTGKGEVRITFAAAGAPAALVIGVRDTGVGIPEALQARIFEAFEQGDSSTNRAYGGTGLGLTISRELARLLGGRITVASQVGAGSTFSLHLPVAGAPAAETQTIRPVAVPLPVPAVALTKMPPAAATGAGAAGAAALPADSWVEGDLTLAPEDRVVLVIDDDRDFGLAVAAEARAVGFKAVLATTGAAALAFVRKKRVAAIVLDIKLPDMSGMSILETLKRDPATRHIPVHMLSALDYARTALSLGAIGFSVKPVPRGRLTELFELLGATLAQKTRRLLLVEDDVIQRTALRQLLGDGDVEVTEAGSGAEALTALSGKLFDCVVLDLKLPDISGYEVLEQIQRGGGPARPPVVIYTGRDLAQDEVEPLRHYADSIVIKGARSPERLLDEVSLFLHRAEANLPPESRKILERLRTEDADLKNRKILVVDDDMRNVFALVSALDLSDMQAVVARNGREALAALEKDPDIELVLMDIMMPVMNGYEAIAAIRSNTRHAGLPIIALTAKAMKADQEKCIALGATDYLAKPVEVNRLTSMLKVWLPARHDA